MKMPNEKLWCVALVTAMLMMFSISPATAVTDTFWAVIGSSGDLVEGGGSGYADGTWYYYDNTDWWNQWFYNAPFDPTRWKEIDVYIEIAPYWENAYAEITINWSSPEWSLQGTAGQPPIPPLSPEEEQVYVLRLDPPLFAGELNEPFVLDIQGIIIPDYNPEWVSIDIRGFGFGIDNGWIDHRCVPEPASLALLGLGGMISLRRRR